MSNKKGMKRKEMKSTRRQRIFNGLYAFLIIMGLLVSALGLRARARQAAANVFTPTQRVGPSTERGAPTIQLQPDEVVLTWRREGGVSSSCETAQVQMDGQTVISPCSAAPPQEPRTFQINSDQVNQLQAWVVELQPFEADFGEPGISTPAQVHLAFQGQGQRAASLQDQQAIEKYVEGLITEEIN